jgi:raffinose/stachyose/melibiose transport system substrate-binding protein
VSTAYPTWDDGSNNLITLNANAEYFFYNKALFTEAGVKPPQTLDELLGTCDQLTDKGITPIAINGKDLWPYYRYLGMPAFRATGNQFLDDLKTGKASMTDPVGIESATFLQDVGRCFQDGFSNTDYTTAINLFTSGKAAMVYDGTWELPSFTDKDGNLKKDIGYFKKPTKGADDVAPPTDFYANSGIGTAILKKSLNPELKDFLAYFFAHYAETAFYDYGVIPSIRPEIRDSVAPVYRDVLDDIAGVGTFAKVWDVQLDPNTGAVMGREGTNLLLKKETPEEFGQKVDASVKEFLATR